MERKATFLPREASQLRPSGWSFCPFLIPNCISSAWMSWLSILFMLNQSRRNKKPKEQNNGKERMVNKCHYSPCESKLTKTFQSEFSMCLNLSQNFQFNLHIDFTYLLFRSKEGKKQKSNSHPYAVLSLFSNVSILDHRDAPVIT